MKNSKHYFHMMLLAGAVILLTACMAEQDDPQQQKSETGILNPAEPDFSQNNSKGKTTTIELFKIEDKGWGYAVLINGKKYVHQEHIPAIQGVHYFNTSEDARKTAELVKYKMDLNILPPSISLREMDSLGVDY